MLPFVLLFILTYPVAINIIGFIASSINFYLYHHTADKQIDGLVTILCLLGGSFGILISILLFEPKITGNEAKSILMSRVFLAVCMVIQLSIVLWVLGIGFKVNVLLMFIMMIHLVIINIIAFILYRTDKRRADKGEYRIPNYILLGVAFVGGTVGALIAIYSYRHKTQKDYYTVGVPLMMVMHFVVFVLFVVNI